MVLNVAGSLDASGWKSNELRRRQSDTAINLKPSAPNLNASEMRN